MTKEEFLAVDNEILAKQRYLNDLEKNLVQFGRVHPGYLQSCIKIAAEIDYLEDFYKRHNNGWDRSHY